MSTTRYQFHFFVLLILAVSVLAFFIIAPFLTPIFLAVLFVIAFYPLHKKVQKLIKWRNTSSIVSTVLVILILAIPLSIFGTLLFQEAKEISERLTTDGQIIENINSFLKSAELYVSERVPAVEVELRKLLNTEELINDGLSVVMGYFNSLFASVFRITIGLFLMVLAIFYLFRDGPSLVRSVKWLSPLPDNHTGVILEKMHEAVNAVVRGRLLVGIIQGFVVGTGLLIFGVPNPVLWGSVAAISAMLPIVGPMFVIVPGAIFLFVSGSIFSAIGLLVWGILAVIIIDEYLGSILVDQKMQIHPFLVLVSVLGGIYFFGPIGFIAGPVVLALLFALLTIYPFMLGDSPKIN